MSMQKKVKSQKQNLNNQIFKLKKTGIMKEKIA